MNVHPKSAEWCDGQC